MLLPESAYTHNMQKLNEKKTDFKTGPISTSKAKDRHLNNDNMSEQNQNIDFYNQADSQIGSQSPMSMALNNNPEQKLGQNLKIPACFDQNMPEDIQNRDINVNSTYPQKQREAAKDQMMFMQQQEAQMSRNILNGGK